MIDEINNRGNDEILYNLTCGLDFWKVELILIEDRVLTTRAYRSRLLGRILNNISNKLYKKISFCDIMHRNSEYNI